MKQLIAGNWKMNLTAAKAVDLVEHLVVKGPAPDVVVCPPFPYLSLIKNILVNSPIALGAQDCSGHLSGAFTGDVSVSMLQDVGCTYVIVGHSERRQGQGETSQVVHLKARSVAAQGLCAIICVGETDQENQAGLTEGVLKAQLQESIPSDLNHQNLVVAYEPVWAIGTGRVASGDEIVAAHRFIRGQLQTLGFDADKIRILYGGSVNGKNAADILALENVNGVLVGGASLKADEFNQIIRGGMCE